MNLFVKIDRLIDYNNHYSLKKAMETLRQEFVLAIKYNDETYAREIIKVTNMVYDKLNPMYKQTEGYEETMSYSQKIVSNKIQQFIESMSKSLGDVK